MENYHNDKDFYKRETKNRIFVNRHLKLEKIKHFGFDMDYTICEYKSPEYEELQYNLGVRRLIEMGYPQELATVKYEPAIPMRGLWLDKQYGTILKVDNSGNILSGFFGFCTLSHTLLIKLYPNQFIQLDTSRIYIMNTLFHLAEEFLIMNVMDYFRKNSLNFKIGQRSIEWQDSRLSMPSIFEDIREAMDWIHLHGTLKAEVINNVNKYVNNNIDIAGFCTRLRSQNAKVFLLTNSDYSYTNKIMDYIFKNGSQSNIDWKSYFDLIFVDAKKPKFFNEGSVLRTVDEKTGTLKIGKQGKVFSGGSCEILSEMLGAVGRDVLYVGDHIFGDILKSKKLMGWRTFLVIPELHNELWVWRQRKDVFEKFENLNVELSKLYKDMDITTKEHPDSAGLQAEFKEVTREMEKYYGELGSIFRSGPKQTFFASQILRYADLYSSSCFNLDNYPLYYMFRKPFMLMPHESTVTREKTEEPEEEIPFGIRRRSLFISQKSVDASSPNAFYMKEITENE